MPRPLIDLSPLAPTVAWTPQPLPVLHDVKDVFLNFETNGLRWWDGDRPISFALSYPTDDGWKEGYWSWGHASDNNTTLDQVQTWSRSLRGIKITNINTRFEVHMGRESGIDFEAMGCRLGDVGHYAAMLDEFRQRNSLDSLIYDYFGPPEIPRLDESRMRMYPASLAAPRAMYNVRMVRQLRDAMWPELDAQGLTKVRTLEEDLIYVVCEMEKNGSPIDHELLRRWIIQSEADCLALRRKISELTGRKITFDLFDREVGLFNPGVKKEVEEIVRSLDLPIIRTATGQPSFTDDILSQYDHPITELIRKLNKLMSLRAKYLVGDQHRISRDGILRYALHQLRAVKDDTMNSGEAGAITGRFSSTEIVEGEGVNIQQRIKVEKQRVSFGYDEDDTSHDDEIYLIRRLHVPAEGEWLSADAMQIEYRLFANEANSPRINAVFDKDPLTSFHRFTHAIFKQKKPDLTYRRMKDVNFAKIYVAGPKKIAYMLGFITKQQFDDLTEKKARNTHPLLAETNELLQIYKQEIPEADAVAKKASEIAKNRGYICSVLGRRQRFPDRMRLHKALNSRIQPSAADIMKIKLVELHKARQWTQFLLRFTVHDEVDGDARNGQETKLRVKEVLDSQDFPFRIPILWDVSTGPNWKECA